MKQSNALKVDKTCHNSKPAFIAYPLKGEERSGVSTSSLSKEVLLKLADYFRRGAKPSSEWRCGLEVELIGYDAQSFERINAAQVQKAIADLVESPDQLVYEKETIIEASIGPGGNLTVEPGGQLEFSGAPKRTLIDTERELKSYLARLKTNAYENGIIFTAVGFDPLRTIDEQHWFPKMRYEVMRPYLARRGRRAWDMMCRTAAIQFNIDYDSDEDLARKFILGNRLAPIITAIFANSPFENGKPSGYKSTRAAAWLETDAERAGSAPAALLNQFSLESFVRYAMDIPMIFIKRNGSHLKAPSETSFSALLKQNHNAPESTLDDWTNHLTTIFTDARIKQHVELRSADCANLQMTLALQALWKGLLYDSLALDEAFRLAPELKDDDAIGLREAVARDGLDAKHARVNVLSLAKDVVTLATDGLTRIAPDEVSYLDVLHQQVIKDEICPADILLHNWHGSWHGSMSKAIDYVRLA